MDRYICITGISSGLGQNAAEYLVGKGYHIIGTVRKDADRERLKSLLGDQAHIIKVDITRKGDVSKLKEKIEDLCGSQGLTGLVNNAGIVESGPLMYLPEGAMENQLNVNVVGVHRVTQVLFPFLRKHGDARVINISSVSGMVSFPFTGAYATSKFALEAYSDALRREVAPFGIKVSVIQPAAVKTRIWSKNISVLENYRHTPYHKVLQNNGKIFKRSEEKGLDPEVISEVIFRALADRKPRSRYLVAPKSWRFKLLSNWLPDRWVDRILHNILFQNNGESLMELEKVEKDA